MPKSNVYYAFLVLLISLFIASKSSFKDQIVRNTGKLIRNSSLESPSEQTLLEGALAGMAESVGDSPYTNYFPPRRQESFKREMQGQFAGVGLTFFVKDQESGEFFFTPLRNSPASKVGLKFGDRLVSVNGENIADKSLVELMRMISGVEKTSVELTIRRGSSFDESDIESPSKNSSEVIENNSEIFTVSLEREVLQQDVVLGDRFDSQGSWIYTLADHSDIGYVAVDQFTDHTSLLTLEALNQLESQGVKKIILDFRNNPGGVLTNAVEICDALLSRGSPIVETREVKGSVHKFFAHSYPHRRFQIVVLVNENSASASEIVAAALQDAEAAVIVGSRTYGKGTVQSIYELPCNMGVLQMTTASFWRPSGRPIHRNKNADLTDDWGVSPNEGFDVPISPLQRFYTAWTRCVRLSEAENKALTPTACKIISRQIESKRQTLRDGAVGDKIEVALEMGIDFDQNSNGNEKTGPTDSQARATDVGNSTQFSGVFSPTGRSPYFDPQLDRAVDYLTEAPVIQ